MVEPKPDTNLSWFEELAKVLRKVPGPIQVVGYFMGAVSVLNLLSNVLKLQSDLFLWVNSYRRLVERVGEFLFGWIDLWWFEVTVLEMHGLVVFGLVFRNSTPSWMYLVNSAAKRVLFRLGYMVLIVALLAILSDLASLLAMGGYIFFLVVGAVSRPTPPPSDLFGRLVEVRPSGARRVLEPRMFVGMTRSERVRSSGFASPFGPFWAAEELNPATFYKRVLWTLVALGSMIVVDQLWLQTVQ